MIRNAQVTDSSAIQEINRTQLGYDCSLEQTTKNLQHILKDTNHHYLLVYEDEVSHQVEGYLHAEIFEETYFEPLFDVFCRFNARKRYWYSVNEQIRRACTRTRYQRNKIELRRRTSSCTQIS